MCILNRPAWPYPLEVGPSYSGASKASLKGCLPPVSFLLSLSLECVFANLNNYFSTSSKCFLCHTPLTKRKTVPKTLKLDHGEEAEFKHLLHHPSLLYNELQSGHCGLALPWPWAEGDLWTVASSIMGPSQLSLSPSP